MSAKVVLTGATGFIATYIFKELLEKGYFVVATVRNPDKAAWLADLVKEYKDNYVFEIVKDIAEEGAFDELFKKHSDIKYVIHTASPFFVSKGDVVKDMLNPALNGTTGILKAAKSYGTNIEKFVLTSSFAAIGDYTAADVLDPKFSYTEKTWDPMTYEQACANGAAAYLGSKTLAEHAFWDFLEKEKKAGTIKFTGTSINPPFVFGPPLQKVDSEDQLNTSNQVIYRLLSSKKGDQIGDGWSLGADVLDVAHAHVKALETDKAIGQRWFVTGGPYNDHTILESIEKAIPELKGKLAEHKNYDMKEMVSKLAKVDASNTREQSGINPMPAEESIARTAKYLYELKKKFGSPTASL